MANHAGLSLAEAVEMRYGELLKEKAEKESQNDDVEALEALQEELDELKDGPPASLTPGSADRIEWFQKWLDSHKLEKDPDPNTMTRMEMLNCLDARPDLIQMASGMGILNVRRVRVAPAEQLKADVERSNAPKWTPAYARVCGEVGLVLLDDESDGTSRVSFPSLKLGAWFPTSALTDAHEVTVIRRIRVMALDKLKPAVEQHEAIS